MGKHYYKLKYSHKKDGYPLSNTRTVNHKISDNIFTECSRIKALGLKTASSYMPFHKKDLSYFTHHHTGWKKLLTPSEEKILLYVHRNSHRKSALIGENGCRIVWSTQDRICEKMKMGRRNLCRALKRLGDLDVLWTKVIRDDRGHDFTLFVINYAKLASYLKNETILVISPQLRYFFDGQKRRSQKPIPLYRYARATKVKIINRNSFYSSSNKPVDKCYGKWTNLPEPTESWQPRKFNLEEINRLSSAQIYEYIVDDIINMRPVGKKDFLSRDEVDATWERQRLALKLGKYYLEYCGKGRFVGSYSKFFGDCLSEFVGTDRALSGFKEARANQILDSMRQHRNKNLLIPDFDNLLKDLLNRTFENEKLTSKKNLKKRRKRNRVYILHYEEINYRREMLARQRREKKEEEEKKARSEARAKNKSLQPIAKNALKGGLQRMSPKRMEEMEKIRKKRQEEIKKFNDMQLDMNFQSKKKISYEAPVFKVIRNIPVSKNHEPEEKKKFIDYNAHLNTYSEWEEERKKYKEKKLQEELKKKPVITKEEEPIAYEDADYYKKMEIEHRRYLACLKEEFILDKKNEQKKIKEEQKLEEFKQASLFSIASAEAKKVFESTKKEFKEKRNKEYMKRFEREQAHNKWFQDQIEERKIQKEKEAVEEALRKQKAIAQYELNLFRKKENLEF